MDDSFSLRGDWESYNEMLATDREFTNDHGITMNPSITINSHNYNGDLNGKSIFEAICQAH